MEYIFILIIAVICAAVYIIHVIEEKKASPPTSQTFNTSFTPPQTDKRNDKYDDDYFTPVLSIAEGASVIFADKGLERFLMRDYRLPDKQITDDNLHEVLVDILRFLELPDIVALIVKSDSDKTSDADGKTQAGSYSRNPNSYRTVCINIKTAYRMSNIIAILCHECTHYFMEYHNLNWNDTELNEQRTDVVANLIGFSKIMTDGYREFKEFKRDMNGTTTITHKIGYITSEDCEDLKRFLEHKRRELKTKAEQERMIANLKNEFIKHLETADILVRQLELIDLSKLNASTPEQAMNIQRALMEMESRNIPFELKRFRECLTNRFESIVQAEKDNHMLYEFCTELAHWLRILQGL